jgi:hypothetical protein
MILFFLRQRGFRENNCLFNYKILIIRYLYFRKQCIFANKSGVYSDDRLCERLEEIKINAKIDIHLSINDI